jgi:hypothetical protein
VLVSHGAIEALGTVFEVLQRRDDGHLRVESGKVEFVWQDGMRVRVSAGDDLTWPRRRDAARPAGEGLPTKSRSPKDGRSDPRRSTAEQSALDTVLKRHLQLVSQRRYAHAVSHLRRALRDRGMPGEHRARLSFELGVLLEDSLGQREEACRHWRDHLARFDFPRYKHEVQRRIRRCQDR